MNPLFLGLIAAVIIGSHVKQAMPPAAEASTTDFDDADFDRYQRGLISLNRRLDAIEATIGGVAVIEIAAMTYMLEKVAGERVWIGAILGSMAVAIGIALFGVLGFQGDETPDLVKLDAQRQRDRKGAISHGIRSIVETYEFNGRQVRRKERLRFVSVWITASVAVIFGLHVLEWVK